MAMKSPKLQINNGCFLWFLKTYQLLLVRNEDCFQHYLLVKNETTYEDKTDICVMQTSVVKILTLLKPTTKLLDFSKSGAIATALIGYWKLLT